ncbi:Bifunctional dethiobiotin synthetase/7-8-diamino-pelargonic acid aminotransferase [Nymphaea thermarum]|nr:Bifunctional dethiobiotin synthetase/7-8-diamino-pelargonic acid aminotransferase [Nymphaea thermarum]
MTALDRPIAERRDTHGSGNSRRQRAAALDRPTAAAQKIPTAVEKNSKGGSGAGTTAETRDANERSHPRWASRTYFSDNGSTAIEIALKMAFRKYSVDHGILSRLTNVKPHMDTIDFKVLALNGSYHGDTLGAMEAQAPSPFTGFLQQPWYLVIHGAGGMHMIDPLFQRVLINECRERGIPVIYDEVFTGFWRLGVESAAELLGCQPDIACYAKLMTGGVIPLAATLATKAVYDSFSGDSKNLNKGPISIMEYLRRVKGIADQLGVAGYLVSDKEKSSRLLALLHVIEKEMRLIKEA